MYTYNIYDVLRKMPKMSIYGDGEGGYCIYVNDFE